MMSLREDHSEDTSPGAASDSETASRDGVLWHRVHQAYTGVTTAWAVLPANRLQAGSRLCNQARCPDHLLSRRAFQPPRRQGSLALRAPLSNQDADSREPRWRSTPSRDRWSARLGCP